VSAQNNMTENNTRIAQQPDKRINPRRRWETVALFLLGACLEFVLALYASGGHWSSWPTITDYYDQQARAFLHGQASLLAEPDPRLAALPDPYDKKSLAGIPTLFDASYYQGRYYLYWGPVPAIGVALVHFAGQELWGAFRGYSRPATVIAFLRLAANYPIGDNIVTFVSASGIMLFSLLILFRIRRKFFPQTGAWLLWIAIPAVVLGSPLAWMLNRPMIYEAAIASGQMFLLGGLCCILPAWSDAGSHPARYALAAGCWACALGSRITLAGAVGVLLLATAFMLLRSALPRKSSFVRLVYLGLPLLLGVALLGAFNYIRFGNLLETGFRYQLGALDYTQVSSAAFDIRYLPLNLFNYFSRPFSIQPAFPWIIPAGDNPTFYPLSISHPMLFYVEPVSGLLLAAPFLLCAFGLLLAIRKGGIGDMVFAPTPSADNSFLFLWISLLCAVVLAIAPLLVYWYCTERFLLDFAPLLLILSACGAWAAHRFAERKKGWRIVIVTGIVGSALWTAAAGLLLGVTGYGSHW
jgi:hypothetical protein